MAQYVQKIKPLTLLAEDDFGNTDFGGMDLSGGRIAKIKVTPDGIWLIHRVIYYIQDGGTWAANKFGGMAALTNGLYMAVYIGETDEYAGQIPPKPIKTVGDFGRYPFTIDFQKMGGTQKFLSAQLIPTVHSAGLWLVDADDRNIELHFHMNDNFTGLDGLSFAVQATTYYEMPHGATRI